LLRSVQSKNPFEVNHIILETCFLKTICVHLSIRWHRCCNG